MNTANAVIPVQERLVTLHGSPGNPIWHIQLKGLTFAYATWLKPSGGDGFVEGELDRVRADTLHIK